MQCRNQVDLGEKASRDNGNEVCANNDSKEIFENALRTKCFDKEPLFLHILRSLALKQSLSLVKIFASF